jgi:hypothetical protein
VTPHENAGTLSVDGSMKISEGSATVLWVDGDVGDCKHQQSVVHVCTDSAHGSLAFNSVTLFPFS